MRKQATNKFSPEVPVASRAGVQEHRGVEYASECAAIGSITAKIGCMAETPRSRVRQGACDWGLPAGPTRVSGNG